MKKHDLGSFESLTTVKMNQEVNLDDLCINEERSFPLIPLRGLVLLPHTNLIFEVSRIRSLKALQVAMEGDRLIVLSPQLLIEAEEPNAEEINPLACLARVQEILRDGRNDTFRVRVQGLMRLELGAFVQADPYYCVRIKKVTEHPDRSRRETALELEAGKRLLIKHYQRYMDLHQKTMPEQNLARLQDRDVSECADLISTYLDLDFDALLDVLNELDIMARVYKLLLFLNKESEMIQVSTALEERVKQAIEEHQREYYLREQLRIVREELGEDVDEASEVERYQEKLQALALPEEEKTRLCKEVKKLEKYPPGMPEAMLLRNYLDLVCELPWGKFVDERIQLTKARKQLDSDHYGLEQVKERLMEYLAVRQRQQQQGIDHSKAPILCLVGPPGVGKTSIAQSIAKALSRPYVRLSLGGVHDEAEVRGHRRTYIGAMPGRFVQAIKTAQCENPLILLDEIDKLGHDFRGDPAAALLEVLDPEQNKAFRDHYLEMNLDLSKVLFLTTANRADQIPPALFDRMEVIELSGYTEPEKIEIAKRHLLPKQAKLNTLPEQGVKLSRDAYRHVIRAYTREAGVRRLEQTLAKLCRRLALKMSQAEEANETVPSVFSLKTKDLQGLLGAPRYVDEDERLQARVGEARGLAWTSVGGETLSIEVLVLEGKGKLELTGQLGEVMQESAKVAMAYIRSCREELALAENFFETHDLHIHIPEGAVPKDGPSAGITLTTALYSALSQRPVQGRVAMTGEMTMRGRVLAIGGLKEKLVAAERLGIREVIIPKSNEKDLEEVPKTVLSKLTIHPVTQIQEVLSFALVP